MKFSNTPYQLDTKHIIPERVVISKATENDTALLSEHPRQAFLGEYPTCKIKKGGYIVLDFGEELQGGADITVQFLEKETVNLRLVFGESVSEAMSTIGEKGAMRDHSPRDITIPLNFLTHFTYGDTGFRFLKLEAVDGDINISSVQGIYRFRDLEYKGSFKCSDELLNKIWQVGAKTVHLNMQEYLIEGIKRDRLVWVGDMHPETSTVAVVFGETDVVTKTLDFITDTTPEDGWMNGLVSYSMWWLKILCDLYFDCGNFEYIKKYESRIITTIENTLKLINDDGTTSWESTFVEWSSAETPDEKAGFYAMLVVGLTAGTQMLKIFGVEDKLIRRCYDAIELIRKLDLKDIKNKQIAAMTALAHINSARDIFENYLKPGGAKGLSTFWGYYVLQAYAEVGETEFALDMIKEYWGGMLKMGATTFWEDFDVEWMANAAPIDEPVPEGKDDIHGDFGKFCYKGLRHSLCHGWASGPTSFLSRHVLGVIPVEPGYKKIRVEPNLGNLDFAEGTIPSPYGPIYVKHTYDKNGRIQTEIKCSTQITWLRD